jgi:hypothetical protein
MGQAPGAIQNKSRCAVTDCKGDKFGNQLHFRIVADHSRKLMDLAVAA